MEISRTLSTLFCVCLLISSSLALPSDYPQEEYHQDQIQQLINSTKHQAHKIVKIVTHYCRRFEPASEESPYTSSYPTYVTLKQTKEMKQMDPPQAFASQDACILFMLGYFDWSKCNLDGLVYNKYNHDSNVNADYLGCDRTTCGPYTGNMKCYNSVPILCHYHSSSNRVGYEVKTPNDEHGWSEGSIARTSAEWMGCYLTSSYLVDLICEDEFGEGWRWATSDMGKKIEEMLGYDYTGADWAAYGPKLTTEWKVWSSGDIITSNYNDFWTYHVYGHNCY